MTRAEPPTHWTPAMMRAFRMRTGLSLARFGVFLGLFSSQYDQARAIRLGRPWTNEVHKHDRRQIHKWENGQKGLSPQRRRAYDKALAAAKRAGWELSGYFSGAEQVPVFDDVEATASMTTARGGTELGNDFVTAEYWERFETIIVRDLTDPIRLPVMTTTSSRDLARAWEEIRKRFGEGTRMWHLKAILEAMRVGVFAFNTVEGE